MMAGNGSKCDCRSYLTDESGDYLRVACLCSGNGDAKDGCNPRQESPMASYFSTCDLTIRSATIQEARSAQEELPATIAIRKPLGVNGENLPKQPEPMEGIQLDMDIARDGHSEPSENKTSILSPENYTVVYFDLETSGFRRTSDILQIAAKSGDYRFCSYVNPTQEVDRDASAVTGLTNVEGKLHLHGQEVISIPIEDALLAFYEFLKLLTKPCLLVAHNAGFDSRCLIGAAIRHSMIDEFQKVVVGFSDSVPLFKKIYPGRKSYKLGILAGDYLDLMNDDEKFHDALYDVEILEQLCLFAAINSAGFFEICETFIYALNNYSLFPLRVNKIVSTGIVKKIASAGISYENLLQVMKTSGKEGVDNLLSEQKIDKKPLVTRNKKSLLAITDFLAKNIN